jgi:hypothetical protein
VRKESERAESECIKFGMTLLTCAGLRHTTQTSTKRPHQPLGVRRHYHVWNSGFPFIVLRYHFVHGMAPIVGFGESEVVWKEEKK